MRRVSFFKKNGRPTWLKARSEQVLLSAVLARRQVIGRESMSSDDFSVKKEKKMHIFGKIKMSKSCKMKPFAVLNSFRPNFSTSATSDHKNGTSDGPTWL